MITTLLDKSELVPREHAPNNGAAKKVQIIPVAPMECDNQGGNFKGHEKHQTDCLEAHITICAQKYIREKVDSWTKETKQNYQ